MQNKITRHHYTLSGMVKLKRLILAYLMVVRMWGIWNPHALLVGMQKMQNVKAHFETTWQCLIKLNTHLPYNATTPLLGIYLKEIKIYVHTDLYINVHCSILCNILKLNMTQTAISSWIYSELLENKDWRSLFTCRSKMKVRLQRSLVPNGCMLGQWR